MSELLSQVPPFLWPVLGYLFGSISSAVIVSKLFSLEDPRKVGSGNPGATNVLRSGNKFAAALTLLGDVLKGVAPVLLAKYVGVSNAILACVAIARQRRGYSHRRVRGAKLAAAANVRFSMVDHGGDKPIFIACRIGRKRSDWLSRVCDL